MAASGALLWEESLAEAEARSRRYEWTEAAELYKQALDKAESGTSPVEIGRVTELQGRAFFKAAFQSESREEFKRLMQRAEASYDSVVTLYQNASLEALSKRAKARGLFAVFWTKDTVAERREVLELAIQSSEEALQRFEKQDNKLLLAETRLDLLTYLLELRHFAQDRKLLKETFERASLVGEKTISELENLQKDEPLLESLFLKLDLISFGEYILGPPDRGGVKEKTPGVVKQISKVSERIGTPYARAVADLVAAYDTVEFEVDWRKSLKLYEASLSMAERTKDSRLLGILLSEIASLAMNSVMGLLVEDSEDRRELLRRGLECGLLSIKKLEIASDGHWISAAYYGYAHCFIALAELVETDVEKKKAHLRKAVEVARSGMELQGYLASEAGGVHSLSKSLYFLAVLESDTDEKTRLLEEALPLRREDARVLDLSAPDSFGVGRAHYFLALIKAELSLLEDDPERKLGFLRAAVSDMETCVEKCVKSASHRPGYHPLLMQYYDWYGDILFQLFQLTGQTDVARASVEAHDQAVSYMNRLGLLNQVAPVRFKIAKTHDALGNFESAFNAFKQAEEEFRRGASKVPPLATVYSELASYMNAWSLIEQARLRHNEERYQEAAESYTKAANVLRQTKQWSQLSNHYLACSLLEEGEALSRQERQDVAAESFARAATAYREAKAELEKSTETAPLKENEKTDWQRISDSRERYCTARKAVEEAKILDKKGEEEASAAAYHSASEMFREQLAKARTEQERRDLEGLAYVCDAWAKMKEAEVKASPQLYAEAANCFAKAQETATRKRFHLLALANASICRALEDGTRFRLTRDSGLYTEIKKKLEIASDYYSQAGLKNAADWTRATQRLFDALVYLANAEAEMEPQKRTELFHLAERHLQLAANLYERAGFEGRREEVLKHLERAKEEKELLLTPIDALAENPAVSSTTISPASLTKDQAGALGMFEVANVVGSLGLSQKELSVGSELTVELEMVNVGKTAATLVKLENVVSDGLEFERENIPYRVEDTYIDMKGKRLEYLKTHEIKIALKTLRKGAFELRPRVLFVDERGNYRSYEFEPASLSVRELGVSGWLKGPK